MTHSDGRSLCFADAHPAAASGQPREPRPGNNQSTADQISISKINGSGTSAGRRDTDWYGAESGTLQRNGRVSPFKTRFKFTRRDTYCWCNCLAIPGTALHILLWNAGWDNLAVEFRRETSSCASKFSAGATYALLTR